ncbi:hypothetical protein E2C01_015879 [Portunus trituberculatus]|uniref:Uncharacterized protein n=1 Tax=Portunus trituberculatus TaxID=210409 RepID=A0A5B7DML9_PORTR|nr:hypothetical protein [Portunus trituberculatus]
MNACLPPVVFAGVVLRVGPHVERAGFVPVVQHRQCVLQFEDLFLDGVCWEIQHVAISKKVASSACLYGCLFVYHHALPHGIPGGRQAGRQAGSEALMKIDIMKVFSPARLLV